MIHRCFDRIFLLHILGWAPAESFQDELARRVQEQMRQLVPCGEVRSGLSRSARIDRCKVIPTAAPWPRVIDEQSFCVALEKLRVENSAEVGRHMRVQGGNSVYVSIRFEKLELDGEPIDNEHSEIFDRFYRQVHEHVSDCVHCISTRRTPPSAPESD